MTIGDILEKDNIEELLSYEIPEYEMKRFQFESEILPVNVYTGGDAFLKTIMGMTAKDPNGTMYKIMKKAWDIRNEEFPYQMEEFKGKLELKNKIFIGIYDMPPSENTSLAKRIYILFHAKEGNTLPMYFTLESEDGTDLICSTDENGIHKILSIFPENDGKGDAKRQTEFVYDYYMKNVASLLEL